TRKTFGMYARQYGLAVGDVAQRQQEMFFGGRRIDKNMDLERRPWRWQIAGGNVVQRIAGNPVADRRRLLLIEEIGFFASNGRHRLHLGWKAQKLDRAAPASVYRRRMRQRVHPYHTSMRRRTGFVPCIR